jgi:uncharacterized phage-associated protein
MTYDARQVANWFVERAARDNRSMSIMSLLKLIYFAHGWHLEMRKLPLIANEIQAWQYGPVIPEVYSSFRSQGINVSGTVPGHATNFPATDEKLLEQIYGIYAQLPAFQLSDLTHTAGGPWHVAREIGGWYAKIPDDLIQQHFELQRKLAS